MSTLAFFIERADQCRREGDEAELPNVKQRCLSAAAAWDDMAARARKTQSYRDAHAAEKSPTHQ